MVFAGALRLHWVETLLAGWQTFRSPAQVRRAWTCLRWLSLDLLVTYRSATPDHRRLGWAALTGVCAGSGIWATHFVAMLAYRGALPTSYEPVATLGSLLIAIGLATCGFALATRCGRWCFALGGAVIGIAIDVTHYVGMHALIVPGSLSWDASLIVFSLVIGVAMSAAAMMVFHLKTGLGAIVAAGSLLTLAICGLHFAAMGAVTVVPDPTLAFQGYGINRSYMALSVAGVTFVVHLLPLRLQLSKERTFVVSPCCESKIRSLNQPYTTFRLGCRCSMASSA